MASSNPVVSGLTGYVEQNKDVYIKDIVLGAPSIARASKQLGIKGSMAVHPLTTSPTLQDGSSCGWNASGSATITARTIVTGAIKVNMDFCEKNLLGTFAEYLVKFGNRQDEMPFGKYIMDDVANSIKSKMEKAYWQGDTTSISTDLKWFDGLLKILDNDASVIDVSIASGASAYDAIKAVYLAIPEELIGNDNVQVKVNVSPVLFRAFLQELVDRNYYHYSADAAPEGILFPGSNVIVVKTQGLAGTRKIVATYDENLVFGGDLLEDMEDLAMWFSKDADEWRLKANWNAGAQVYFPDFVVLGTMAADAVSPSSMADALASIKTSTGAIATSAAAIATSAAGIDTSAETLAGAVNNSNQIETHPNE